MALCETGASGARNGADPVAELAEVCGPPTICRLEGNGVDVLCGVK